MGPRANPAPKSQFEPITLHSGTIWAEKVTEKISVQNRFIQLSTLFRSTAGQSFTNEVLQWVLFYGRESEIWGPNLYLIFLKILGLAMRMFPPRRRYHPICDDCIGQDRDSRHLGTSYNNSHTQWNPVTNCCLPILLCTAGCILQAKLISLDT